MRHCLALTAIFLVGATAFGDLPPLPFERREPRPIRIPNPPPNPPPIFEAPAIQLPKPPGETALKGKVDIAAQPAGAEGITLQIPRAMFNQLKKAAIDVESHQRNAGTQDLRRLPIAGLAMSLAFVSAGLLTVRRVKFRGRVAAIGGLAACMLGAVACANVPPPYFKKVDPPHANQQQLAITIVNDGDSMTLRVPASMLPASSK